MYVVAPYGALMGVAELNKRGEGAGVAWWAHVGGFAADLALCVGPDPSGAELKPQQS